MTISHIKRTTWLAFYVCSIVLAVNNPADAQSKAAQKAVQRYEIDAKKMGVDVTSNDALPRSREFIRIDSTYYVGWMYEGSYKFTHAADYIGFKNAAIPLERALYLMERDYKTQLSTRTPELIKYFPVYPYHIDYTRTAYFLMTCYANTEEPDKVVALMRRVLRWKFQRDFYMDAYNYLGWTVHRYRFYTRSKYAFLRNSIGDNEQLAMSYLDSGMTKIERDKKFNASIFQQGYEALDKVSVYHYKCILYSYGFNIDSAELYFDKMRKNNALPHNNYANFKSVCGNFREAEKEYTIAAGVDINDKRLQEWAYYSSIIDIYKAKPKAGIELSKDMITANGSTPGFGWYNIALARSMHFDGQIAESEKYTDKASEFKELHIGTTLGQSHYDFSIQLLKLLNKDHQLAMQRFENKNWWYTPSALSKMAQLLAEKYLQQYLIINQFAQNPERDRVIYKLFSTESTVSWDEVWYLVKDFSSTFFVKRFEKEIKEDKRPIVKKYFKLFIARLKISQGKYEEAKLLLHEILRDPNTDLEYEKLLAARTFQALAECAEKEKNDNAYRQWSYQSYKTFPQLMPFTGLRAPIQLTIHGTQDKILIDRLKACNIAFTADGAASAMAHLNFTSNGNRKMIEYYVNAADGKTLVPRQKFIYSQSVQGAIDLAYRLYNIGGKTGIEEVKDAGTSTLKK